MRWRCRCTYPYLTALGAPEGQKADTLTPSSIETSSTAVEAPPMYSMRQNQAHELVHIHDVQQDPDAPEALAPLETLTCGGFDRAGSTSLPYHLATSSPLKPESPTVVPFRKTDLPSSVQDLQGGRIHVGSGGQDVLASSAVEDFIRDALHRAVDDFVSRGAVQQMMQKSLDQAEIFSTACSAPGKSSQSRGGPGVCDIRRISVPARYLPASPVCHRTSATGVFFGSVWVRRSTLICPGKRSAAAEESGQVEVVTSVIFYPAPWLGRIGLGGHGVEAKLYRSAAPSEWKFKISAVRAVPDNALIFQMCRQGNIMAVRAMLQGGHASVRDTSPAGWTPLHVRHPTSRPVQQPRDAPD